MLKQLVVFLTVILVLGISHTAVYNLTVFIVALEEVNLCL